MSLNPSVLWNVMEVAPKSPIKGRMLAFLNNMCVGYHEDNNVVFLRSGDLLKIYLTTVFFTL